MYINIDLLKILKIVFNIQNYCTLLFHDRYYVFPRLYRAKNSLGKVDMNDIFDIYIGSR